MDRRLDGNQTAPQVARIRTRYAAGIGATIIAAKLQLSFTAIRRVLDRCTDEAKDQPALRPKPDPVPARRHVARIDGPSPVAVHLGRQVRLHRTVAGLSQSQLGEAMGLTFQQVQKYERRKNRMSFGVQARIAGAPGVPPTLFFLGLRRASGLLTRTSSLGAKRSNSPAPMSASVIPTCGGLSGTSSTTSAPSPDDEVAGGHPPVGRHGRLRGGRASPSRWLIFIARAQRVSCKAHLQGSSPARTHVSRKSDCMI